MDNILDIVKSWAKLISASENDEKKAIERTGICKSCEFIKLGQMDVCGACGCPIRAKVFSNKGCPVGKW